MAISAENLVIKKLLTTNVITNEEYNILFCDKDSWFTIDSTEKYNWEISEDKQIKFWNTMVILPKTRSSQK